MRTVEWQGPAPFRHSGIKQGGCPILELLRRPHGLLSCHETAVGCLPQEGTRVVPSPSPLARTTRPRPTDTYLLSAQRGDPGHCYTLAVSTCIVICCRQGNFREVGGKWGPPTGVAAPGFAVRVTAFYQGQAKDTLIGSLQ